MALSELTYDELMKRNIHGNQDVERKKMIAERLTKLQNNSTDFVRKFGVKEYKRQLSYLTTRKAIDDNNIDINQIAPNFRYYDKLMTDGDDFKNKFGQKRYDQEYTNLTTALTSDFDTLNNAVKIKQKGGYSSKVLETSPELAKQFIYDEGDEEDQYRKLLGMTPKSFDSKAAKAIIKKGKEIEQANATSTIGENATEEQKQAILGSLGLNTNAKWYEDLSGDSNVAEEELLKYIELLQRNEKGMMGNSKDDQGNYTQAAANFKTYILQSGRDPSMVTDEEIDKGTINPVRAAEVKQVRDAMIQNPDAFKDKTQQGADYLNAMLASYSPTVKNIIEGQAKQEQNAEQIQSQATANNVNYDEAIKAEENAIAQIEERFKTNMRGSQATTAKDEIEAHQAKIAELQSQKSVAEQAKKKSELLMGVQGKTDVKQGDNIINYINKPDSEKLVDVALLNSYTTNPIDQQLKKYAFVEPEEAEALKYYYQNDKAKYEELKSILDRDLNERLVKYTDQADTAMLDKMGDLGKVAAGITSVAEGFITPAAYFENAINTITGKRTDVNSPFQQTVGNQQKFKEYALKNADDTGRFFGEAAFGIADMAAKLPLGSVGAPLYMSMSSAGQTTYDALKRGASNEEAFLLGTINGAVEYFTEKIPIERILKAGKMVKNATDKITLKTKLLEILKNAGAEGAQELVTEYTNTLTDMAFMGERSQYNQYIKSLVDSGMSEEEATKQANTTFFVLNPLKSGAMGAITGGILTGGNVVINSGKKGNAPTQTKGTIPEAIASQLVSKSVPTPKKKNVQAQEIKTTVRQADYLNEQTLNTKVKDTKLRKTIKEKLNIKTPLDEKFKQDLSKMESVYQTTDNKTQKRVAKEFVDSNFEKAEQYLKENQLLQSPADAAIASEIIDRYRNTGRADEALELIRQTAVKFSKAGQQVQSAAIWAKMTPEGTIKAIDNAIKKANQKLSQKKQFSITDEDSKFLMDTTDKLNAGSQEDLKSLFLDISNKRQRTLGDISLKELDKMDIDTLRDATYQNMMLYVMDKVPRTLGQKLSIIQAFGHLINPKTALRNIGSNTIFKWMEEISDYPSTIFDMLISLKTKQRTVGVPSLKPSDVKQDFQASKNYAKKSVFEVQTGIDLGGESGKYDLFTKEAFPASQNKTLNFIERVLGYELKTPDQFAKGGTEIREIRKQLQLQKKDVKGKSIEELLRMADEETLQIAKDQAKFGTFQDDSLPAKLLTGFKRVLNIVGINKGDFGLGDLYIKYTKVPGNIIQRSIDYSPVGLLKLLKFIGTKNLSRTQQREISKTIGRAITGTATSMTMGYLLTKAGIMVSPSDNEDRERKYYENAGLKGRKINLSAIGRILSGESPELKEGDNLVSFDWLDVINTPMAIGHELAKTDGQDVSTEEVMKNMGITFMEETLDLPTLYIINKIVYEREENPIAFLTVPATEAIPGFIPSPLRQASQGFDDKQRETKTFIDKMIANTPFRSTLPEKLDTFGQPIKQDTGLQTLFNPGNTSTYLPKIFTNELKRLADKNKDYEVYPTGKPVKEFDRNKKTYTLDEENQRKFMKEYGDALMRVYEKVLKSNASDKDKIAKLKKYQSDIKDNLKDKYLANKQAKERGG